MSSKEIPNNAEFMEAALSAWNTLSTLIDNQEPNTYQNIEEFKDFYRVVIYKLLEETESE